MKEYSNKETQSYALFGLGFMETIPSPRLGFLWGKLSLLANHLASNDNLTRTTGWNRIPTKTNNTEKGALINNNTIKHMLRCDRQIKPGLVALYDIQPENGASLFLQPRSPHGAEVTLIIMFINQYRTVTIKLKSKKAEMQKDTHIGVENFSETIQIIKCIVPILHQNFWRKFAPQHVHVVTIGCRHLGSQYTQWSFNMYKGIATCKCEWQMTES